MISTKKFIDSDGRLRSHYPQKKNRFCFINLNSCDNKTNSNTSFNSQRLIHLILIIYANEFLNEIDTKVTNH